MMARKMNREKMEDAERAGASVLWYGGSFLGLVVIVAGIVICYLQCTPLRCSGAS